MNNEISRDVIIKTIPTLLQEVKTKLVFEDSGKLYDNILIDNLSYDEALEHLNQGLFITRKEWDGFHFLYKGKYAILLKDRSIILNPQDVYSKDAKDWCVVDITAEAIDILFKYDKK